MKCACVLLLSLCNFLTARAQQGDALIAGSGGGFTGMANAYKIFTDGKVYKGSGVAEIQYTACAKIRKAKAKKLIHRATQTLKDAGEFNAPGNQYYFLTIILQEKETKVTWGAPDRPTPGALKDLYQEVQGIAARLTYRPIP
jgi:uncharacterized lipoprotein YehR (DUF1307 family)